MAAMEAMMGGIDAMGGRGCGSRITDKGLKMGSKKKNAKVQPVKAKAKVSPAMSKGPPPTSTRAAAPPRKQVSYCSRSCAVLCAIVILYFLDRTCSVAVATAIDIRSDYGETFVLSTEPDARLCV